MCTVFEGGRTCVGFRITERQKNKSNISSTNQSKYLPHLKLGENV